MPPGVKLRTKASMSRKMAASTSNTPTARTAPPARYSTSYSRSPTCSFNSCKRAASFARLSPTASVPTKISPPACSTPGATCSYPPMDSDRSTAVAIRSVSIHPNLNRHAYSSYGFFLLPWPGKPNPKVSLACRCCYYIPCETAGLYPVFFVPFTIPTHLAT